MFRRSRVLLVAIAAVSLVMSVPAAADGPSGCGATAPISPYCSSGWHQFDAQHDEASIYGDLVYTGTVESTLRYPGGEWIYSCTFVGGVERGCDWLGQKPLNGTWVYHTCDSYYLPVLYGGVGEYGCIMR